MFIPSKVTYESNIICLSVIFIWRKGEWVKTMIVKQDSILAARTINLDLMFALCTFFCVALWSWNWNGFWSISQSQLRVEKLRHKKKRDTGISERELATRVLKNIISVSHLFIMLPLPTLWSMAKRWVLTAPGFYILAPSVLNKTAFFLNNGFKILENSDYVILNNTCITHYWTRWLIQMVRIYALISRLFLLIKSSWLTIFIF